MPLPAQPFQNPDGPAPTDQNKVPANLLYDPITHAVVSERAVNVQQDSVTKVFYGDKAAPSGGSLTNDGTFAQENGGHLANIDAAIGGQGDTPAASPTVAGSILAFLKAILAGILSPVVPSYEYNSGTTGTVDRVRNAQGKGYATAAIAGGGAATGQNVITLSTSAPASLQVGMQIQLIGGTEEPADITAISGTAVTLSSNIVNASHTSIGWDTFAVNGPLASLFSAIGVSLRGLVLYNPNGSVATPYQQAQSDGNGALKVASADGANVTIGTTTDASSALTLVGLLKAIKAAVTGLMSFIQPDVTTSGNITAAQPSIGTTVTNASVTLAVGNGQSSWRAQLTGLTATDVMFVDHSTDNGTTWNSSTFMVGGAANNTPVSSVTALSAPTELSGNDAGVSHIRIRCGTYNTGDTIGVYIRAGFGIGRLGIISPLPAGSNSIGSVNVGTMPSIPAGANQIGHVVVDSGVISGIGYRWNGGAPANQNFDRLRSVQGMSPKTATISSGAGAASTAPVLSAATGLQPGQWVLLSNGTPASDATAEWVLTTSTYVAGVTTLALTSGIVTAGHTNAYWNAYTVFGPQLSLFSWEGVGAQGLVLNNGTQAILAQGDANGNLKIASADGAQVTQGQLADNPATSGTGGSWSLASLLRGALNALQGVLKIRGDYSVTTGLTVNALNADLVPATDISMYRWWSLQINGTWTGSLTFAGSNDGTSFTNVEVVKLSAVSFMSTTLSSAGSFGDILAGIGGYTYLRVRASSWTSGPANGVLALFTTAPPPHLVGSLASQNGTWTVQPGNTVNTTAWLTDVSDRVARLLGAVTITKALSAVLYSTTQTAVFAWSGTGDISGTGNYTELWVNLNVSAIVGGASVVFKVQRKDSFGNWITAFSGAAVTATGSQTYSVGAGLNGNHSFGNDVQVVWGTVSGLSAGNTITFTLDIYGK